MYEYKARIVQVHDGDTFTADIDMGFDLTRRTKLRLNGCNAIELRNPGGFESQQNLAAILQVGPTFWYTIRTFKPYKYGDEWMADVVLAGGSTLVQELIAHGWLAPWNGLGTPPTPTWPRVTT